MDIHVFTMVGEWKCKEEEWKFEPWEGWFGRCVRVRQNMTYTEFVRTLCEVFSLKCTECNPIISYWMPGKMSVMIESKRPPVYLDSQMSLDTFFLIRGGDPSVTLFVSFITTVKALGNTIPRTDGESYRVCGSATTPNPIVAASNVDGNNEAVDEQDDVEDDKTDTDEEEEEDNEDGAGYDDYQGDDGSMGGSTLDPTIDGSEGSGEDYDYNKWNDLIIEEYGIGNVEEDVILTQQTVQHPGEFSRLLAECTYTSHRVRGGDNSVDRTPTVTPRRTCQHGLYQCTYTTECVQDTGCEGNTDTNINGIDDVSGDDVIDRGIGDSPSGTLDDNRLVTAPGGDNISHSGDRTPTVTPRRTCQHGLNHCTYTTECVQDTGCEGNTDTNINGIYEVTIDRGIGASASGTLNDNRLVTAAEAYEVYNDFSTLHGGELEILDNDAAPVFDDLANFRDDETQVELSTTGETLYVGSVFKNRKVIQQTMSYLAIKQCFCYNQRRSCPTRLEMVCVDDTCPWHLTAQVVKNSECFKITSYDTTHTCDIDTRKNYNKHASYKLLGEVVKSRYSSTQGGPRAVDLPQLLLNDLNVRISYSTAWRAKEVAVENVRGDDIKSYRFLPTYLYLLKLANPGTITHLHSTPEADGTQRFKYDFVSLGASIKDGNFQIFPIAFGVVDGETDASWVWFFDKLADIVPDSEDLMIVSDRHSSIYKGLSVVYPKAHHGACAVHLERNISTYYGKYGVSGLFFSAAKAYRVRDFEKYFEQLRAKSAACANYLEEIGFEHWTRAHCKGERYNIMSSNNSESMNNVLTRAKSYPIVYMIEFIREVLMRWFAARRQKVARCKSLVTPEVDERFLQDLPALGKFAVKMSGPWSYQVTSKSGEHFHVVLDECTCTCLRYTKLRIPCEHGLAAAIEFGIDPKVVVGWWYGLQTFSDSFQEPILPIADPKDVVIPQHISDLILIPPYCRRPPGRPTTKRIPSRGENRITGWTICVFVVRVFKKFVAPNIFELGLILADNSGSRSRIEATIDRRLAPFYIDRIKENEWKIVTTFLVRNVADPVRATSHDYGIWFMDRTVVTNALRRDPISFYDFTQFDYILEKTVDKKVLVDVIGALLEVGHLTGDFDGLKLPFKIKDRYNEVLECEAHNEQALEFQTFFRSLGQRNVVVALVFWRLTDRANPKVVSHGPVSKVFADPDTPEVEEIKQVVF
ncbi:Nucleic acid-binding OB-fold [Arabidopsis suecica]|uniref:Nucleic acid-binding OB-fold n=1 Tax=Arabidopsis suecica TaxID=45249 RepID=A0A8T2BMY9_ARASU|nr:Nucleic acid-binding OB-fold [Arabidopsis suecica]